MYFHADSQYHFYFSGRKSWHRVISSLTGKTELQKTRGLHMERAHVQKIGSELPPQKIIFCYHCVMKSEKNKIKF